MDFLTNLKQINWFDIVVILGLLLGFVRGRKHGISLELLHLLQWLCIVGAGAEYYGPLGQLIVAHSVFPLLICNVIAYLLIAMVVKMIFSRIQALVGDKLVNSDAFGKMEFTFGMIAGLLRSACIIIFVCALLHARLLTPGQIAEVVRKPPATELTMPEFRTIQHEVFYRSFTGRWIKEHLSLLLIAPRPYEEDPTSRAPAAPRPSSIFKQKTAP